MATQVVMPKLSPTMEEGQISRWLKKEGDKVTTGEPIAEIDTDKATMEMQALGSGVIRKILINEGESVPLGQLIAVIGDPNEDISEFVSRAAQPQAASSAPKEGEASSSESAAPVTTSASPPTATPAASSSTSTQGNGAGAQSAPSPDKVRLLVSPIAARMAAEAGINLREVNGSGPGGRIIKRDIESIMQGAQNRGQAGAAEAATQKQVAKTVVRQVSVEGASPYTEEPMSEMRRVIARRLVTSIGPVPHFFLTIEIEMDRTAELRRLLNEQDPDLKISYNDIIIKAAAYSLIQHPKVNASFQDRNIRYYERADIGVAVAIEDGLITPIVRAAESKGLAQIASEVREMAERARAKKLKPEEYTGATFSISNLGMFGIDEFTAVINPPESGILAVGGVTPKPVARDGQVVVRPMMRVTMSCDHRVIDGATGARFLQTFKKSLENPLVMLV